MLKVRELRGSIGELKRSMARNRFYSCIRFDWPLLRTPVLFKLAGGVTVEENFSYISLAVERRTIIELYNHQALRLLESERCRSSPELPMLHFLNLDGTQAFGDAKAMRLTWQPDYSLAAKVVVLGHTNL